MAALPPIGSLADFGTFVLILFKVMYDYDPRLRDMGAGLVAVAEHVTSVDDDALQSDLEVERRDVDDYITDGGPRDE